MTRPGAVHQTHRFVLLVLFKYGERPRIQLGVFAARVKRRHTADGEHAVLVAHLG